MTKYQGQVMTLTLIFVLVENGLEGQYANLIVRNIEMQSKSTLPHSIRWHVTYSPDFSENSSIFTGRIRRAHR